MSIFQKSVINKHLKNLDKDQVEKAYQKFKVNYSPAKIEEIKQLKEEEYQDGFLREIFVDVLGYTLRPDENFDLQREFKNQTDGKKADGAIIKNENAIAVIELKSAKTKDLTLVTQQAFNYKNNQSECKYVITSNFQKLRFYIDYATEYEEFDLFHLTKDKFDLIFLILSKESIFANLPLKLKEETQFHDQNISDKLYKDYSNFKRKLYGNLTVNHNDIDKLTLFKKSQKLLDRFLFILFAEDSGLLPPNSISRIIKRFEILKEEDAYKPLYEIFKQYFGYMNVGRKGKKDGDDISAYNGGLFYKDKLLDILNIDDKVLINDLRNLSEYDFNTEVDVNILGHIFEHSLNEIEEITVELSAIADTRGHVPLTSKRKKDGIFYTPKYITQYIVENTIGTLCNEKRKNLEIEEIEFDDSFRTKDGALSVKGKKLFKKLNDYKDWLYNLKIVDPACGSGAFLNQALNFLIAEHKNIDDIIADLTNTPLRLFDVDKNILENNLFGVDINEESVEIAKLSLWLRTAQKGRKLSVLSNNIKCGNSLIDDPKIAGDKAFDWHKEFSQVFNKKEKKAWHITTATHNSRYSQRMFDNHVKLGEAIWLSEQDAIYITGIVADIVKEDNLNIIAYNICGDHMHILLVCDENEFPKIIGKIKAVSGRRYNIEKGITVPATNEEGEDGEEGDTTRGHVPLSSIVSPSIVPPDTVSSDTVFPSIVSPDIVPLGTASPKEFYRKEKNEKKRKYNSLWTQKFGKRKITDNNDLRNVINYIRTNRQKHKLPENEKLKKIINKMTCSVEHAFQTEYNGGFDVVIGNPPYGAELGSTQVNYFRDNYKTVIGHSEIYYLFIEQSVNKLISKNGLIGFIIPNAWLSNKYATKVRELLINETEINCLINFNRKIIFKDANVETSIFIIKNKIPDENNKTFVGQDIETLYPYNQVEWKNNQSFLMSFAPNNKVNEIIQKVNLGEFKLSEKLDISNGIKPYQAGYGINLEGIPLTLDNVKSKIYHSNDEVNKSYKKELKGKGVHRYSLKWEPSFINWGKWLMSPKSEHYFEQPKILIRQIISDYFYAVLDYEKYYADQSLYICTNYLGKDESLGFYLALLNSKLYGFYFRKFYSEEDDLFPKIKVNELKNLPVKSNSKEEQNIFSEKANKMLNFNKQLQEKSNRFIKRVSDNFVLEKITKKLEAFYENDFKTFVSELKKQKVVLSLIQQDEWEEYFNSYKTEINQIQTEINKTDHEIDQMVYKLYELTDEEIGIIENSIK